MMQFCLVMDLLPRLRERLGLFAFEEHKNHNFSKKFRDLLTDLRLAVDDEVHLSPGLAVLPPTHRFRELYEGEGSDIEGSGWRERRGGGVGSRLLRQIEVECC